MGISMDDLLHAEHIFLEENPVYDEDVHDSTLLTVKTFYNQGAHDMIAKIIDIFFCDDSAE